MLIDYHVLKDHELATHTTQCAARARILVLHTFFCWEWFMVLGPAVLCKRFARLYTKAEPVTLWLCKREPSIIKSVRSCHLEDVDSLFTVLNTGGNEGRRHSDWNDYSQSTVSISPYHGPGMGVPVQYSGCVVQMRSCSRLRVHFTGWCSVK